MKLNKLNKFLALCIAGLGVFFMTSCESAERNAYVDLKQTTVTVYEEQPATGKSYALASIGVVNNTIYNVYAIDLTYQMFDAAKTQIGETTTVRTNCFIRHGVAGYLVFDQKFDTSLGIKSIEIIEAKPSSYASLWQTYVVPFTIAIIAAVISTIVFGARLFVGGMTREDVKDLFRERLSSTLVTVALVLIICLIPLMFSNWVVTLILVGAVLSTILLSGLLTLIKMATIKK